LFKGSIEGWLVIEGSIGQQILQADNQASSVLWIPLNHPPFPSELAQE